MSALRTIIDGAVADAIAANPKYFAAKQEDRARAAIVRKIMAALLRDDDAEKPEEAEEPNPKFVLADAESREARGYLNLRRIAGAVPPRRDPDGRVIIAPSAYCEAVFALADLPDAEQWPFLTAPQNIEAWREFFRVTLGDTVRRSIMQERGGESGILMPFYWPPSKTGKTYSNLAENSVA